MAPTPEFGMDKMNPAPKINNKVEGTTPKPETKKVKVRSPRVKILVAPLMVFLPAHHSLQLPVL